jgi:esterase
MIDLNFKEYGSGDNSVIILHGFLGSLDNWHTLATDWSKAGLHIYSLDLRNHGKSPHTETHSIQLMVDDLNDFMFQHHIEKATILGHSMGGKVAMLFALQYPSLCTQLIVADIAPKEYKRGHDEIFTAIFEVNLNSIQTRKEAEEAMKPFIGDFGTRQFILKNLERKSDGEYSWKFNIRTLFQDYDEIRKPIKSLHTYNEPTLFLKGSLSTYIQDEDINAIKSLFPYMQIKTIADAGHWLHADKPTVFYETILAFCK